MQRIFNKDGFNWWIGVVEDREDPEKLGRVKIRIFGYHTDNKALLPTEDLPWAIPIHPITSAATSGVGVAPLGPLPGTWLMGFFLDGEDMQQPAFIGAIGTKTAQLTFKEADIKPEVKNRNDGLLKDGSNTPIKDSQGFPVRTAVPSVPGWFLGKTTLSIETAGRGPGAINQYANLEDIVGASYGAFQFASYLPLKMPSEKARPSSRVSPLKSYLRNSKFFDFFKDLVPATPAFDSKWIEMASTYPKEFLQDQRDYVKNAYYNVMLTNLQRVGVDLTSFGPGVQDLIWSTAYQLGPNYISLFVRPLKNKGVLTDRDIITLVSEYKIASVEVIFRSQPELIEPNRRRYISEKSQLLSLVTI